MNTQKIDIDLDLGDAKDDAFRYHLANKDATLSTFVACYTVRARKDVPEIYFDLPLEQFNITFVTLKPSVGVPLSPKNADACRPAGELNALFDRYYADDIAAEAEPEAYPDRIIDNEAVQIAYRHELQAISRFLQNDLSVLILCDKMLTEHIYEYVCKLGGRKPVLDDALPEGSERSTREAFERAIQGGGGVENTLPLLIRNLKSNQVLVVRGVDALDSPSLIEVLYQGGGGDKRPQLLGFLDPSLEVKKVVSNRFAVHARIMGLPRYIQPDADKPPVHAVSRLITAKERKCFKKMDAEGVYKNVSGLNAIQFRNAMRYVGATVAEGSDAPDIYKEIRQFKTSSSEEIDIPDTTFEDIGGYESVKQELKRMIALVSGRVPGMSEREREKLIPRGFIFHGEPGTGKTLFAKAIANEMNATIQMVSGPEIMDKYVGQSESNLRQIFATARRNAPSVIFFDEFDSIAGQRSAHAGGGERANNAVVAQLLTELDGFRRDQAVLLIGTTNRIDIIDEALLRPSRLRPIEIGMPDFNARREVARKHAESFGVEVLLADLCRMAQDCLPEWRKTGEIPAAFWDDLFAQHPPYRTRFDAEDQGEGFRRDLQAFFRLVRQVGTETGDGFAGSSPVDRRLEDRVIRIARKYGLDLTRPDSHDDGAGGDDLLFTMRGDIRDIFNLMKPSGGLNNEKAPARLLDGVLDLVAEYTEGFNNDEIRAIFQEASTERHLEGRLVTPRYLGMKIGMIKKRRDEREVTHLSDRRGRR